MKRRDALGDYSLKIEFSESSECREVSVKERQSVIVVLQIQRLPQIRRQLIDEAELAVIVTSPDLIEKCRMDFSPEGLAILLFHINDDLESSTIDVEAQFTFVGKQSIGDDVPWNLAIEPQDQISGQ